MENGRNSGDLELYVHYIMFCTAAGWLNYCFVEPDLSKGQACLVKCQHVDNVIIADVEIEQSNAQSST